jgi:putative transposase
MDELLNEEIFDTLEDARRKLAHWRYDDNAVRPHCSLGNQTPLDARRMRTQNTQIQPADSRYERGAKGGQDQWLYAGTRVEKCLGH